MDYTHGTRDTADWFKKAKPEPTSKDLSTQIGVHFEEVAEFIDTLALHTINDDTRKGVDLLDDAYNALVNLAKFAKEHDAIFVNPSKKIDALDGLADQIVTAVGVGHCAGMDIVNGLNEVNRSNFSKFDDYGNPLLDKDRKIMKGPNYSKPDLTPFV